MLRRATGRIVGDRYSGRDSLFSGLSGMYSAVQQALAPIFNLPAITSLIPTFAAGSATPTFTRATTKYVTDFEGVLRQCLSGEAGFTGARRVENLYTSSASIAVSGNKTVTVAVGTYIFSMGAEATGTCLITFTGTATGSTGTLTANASSRTAKTLTITGAGTIIATCTVAAAANVQLENVTGQSIQVAASYVDSATSYGVGVNGVAAYATTNGNTMNGTLLVEAAGAAISDAAGLFTNVESARTNLCLQSNDPSNGTWGQNGTVTTTQDLTGPDGKTSGWTLTDNGIVVEQKYQRVSLTNGTTYTYSQYVAKTVGAQAAYPTIQCDDGVSKIALATIDTSNGVATIWTTYAGCTMFASSVTCVSHNASWWRVAMTFTVEATADHNIYITPAGTTNATQSTGAMDGNAQGSAGFACCQLEVGSAASSPITTTTLAVTRAADQLSVAAAGVLNNAVGTAYCETMHEQIGAVDAAGQAYLGDTVANRQLMFVDGAAHMNVYDGTNSNGYTIGTIANGVVHKQCVTWGPSGINLFRDGARVGSANRPFDGDFNIATLGIGWLLTSYHLNGNIRNVQIYGKEAPASQAQAMTT